MRIVNLASGKAAQIGYEYYKNGNVLSWEQVPSGVYRGKVRDEDGSIRTVTVDTAHPRKTSCDCPFAEGRRVVCEHAVALYFAIFPADADEYKAECDEEEARYREHLEEEWNDRYFDSELKRAYAEAKREKNRNGEE